MKKNLVLGMTFVLLLLVAACGSKTGSVTTQSGKPIATVKINDLTATVANDSGQLKNGPQELTLSFTDSTGKPVDVGAVSLNFHMPAMGSMAAMNNAVSFTTTSKSGVYNGKVNIDHAGEWQGQLAYEGPAGKGKGTFSVTAR
jgi:hypothetical protein